MATMSEGTMLIAFMVFFPVMAILSRRAALDLDSRGQPGWIYGLLVLFWFPVGLVIWLIAREGYPRVENRLSEPKSTSPVSP
jgi:hypothetical protein